MNFSASICDENYRISGGQEMDTLQVRFPEDFEVIFGEIQYIMKYHKLLGISFMTYDLNRTISLIKAAETFNPVTI